MSDVHSGRTRERVSVNCFKAYDIRGWVPDELNAEIAYRVGRAFVAELKARTIAVGRDMRMESPMLAEALMRGITEGGANVIDIGLCGTSAPTAASWSPPATTPRATTA
jgi:phosphomannomutase/phosphoglucomutase